MISTVVFTCHRDTYTVRYRYDPKLVELLKDVVPAFARTWEPEAKHWRIDVDYARELASAIRAAGHRVIGLDEPPPKTPHSTDPAQWAHILFKRVGPDRVDPVHRDQNSAPRQRRHRQHRAAARTQRRPHRSRWALTDSGFTLMV